MPPKKRRLTSDELGAKGEAKFRELCADAKLICNKADRDLAGWDFIVTFPFPVEEPRKSRLDSRKVPPSCHVQVKAIWDSNDAIKLRLSSAEWLAKELKPSFIYVLKVNEALDFTDSFLVHLLDAPLATILRRLRVEESKGRTAPNQTVISMSARKLGRRIEPTGAALREALEDVCGPDLQKYIDVKAEQLAKLGFDGYPVQLKVKLHAENGDELVDAFLGLKPNIPATDVRVSETRFGIKLPISNHKEAKITIQPHAADTCTITVRSSLFGMPAAFKAKLFIPGIPNLPVEFRKFKIDAEIFSIVGSKLEYTISTDAGTEPQSLSRWVSFWKLGNVLANGEGTITVVSDKGSYRLDIDVTSKLEPDVVLESKRLLTAAEAALVMTKLAGIAEEPSIPHARLLRVATHLLLFDAIAHPSPANADISVTLDAITSDNPVDGEEVDMAFISYIPFGAVIIGYYATITLVIQVASDGIRATSKKFKLGDVQVLTSSSESYAKLIETAKQKTGCQSFYALPFPTETTPQALEG